MTKTKNLLAVALALQATAALCAPPTVDREVVTAALTQYLHTHGELCLGKVSWPVDLSERDVQSRSRDAVQMPVLEHLGLVAGTPAVAQREEGEGSGEDQVLKPVAVRRYTLTDAGRAYYREHEIPGQGANGGRTVRHHDLCAGTLQLASLVRWEVTSPAADAASAAQAEDASEFIATYTYRLSAAPWATAPEFRQVFPMVARVADGVGTMQLKQRLRKEHGQWVPAGLAE